MPKSVDAGAPANPAAQKRDPFEDFVRDQWGRPKLPPPGKVGREHARTAYTRASTLGSTLEDGYNLGIWRAGQALWGASRSAPLRKMLAAIETATAPDDKAKLKQAVEKAMAIAESDGAATQGTATHALIEQHERGAKLEHIDEESRAALDAWDRLTVGFEKVASEIRIVCDRHEVAGSGDWLLRLLAPMTTPDGEVLPAGTLVFDDTKTSATSAYFGLKFAVQLAKYGHGKPFDPVAYGRFGDLGHGDDGWAALTGGGAPHPRWALITHIPTGRPEDSALFWVDITAGEELAELCVNVRNWRKSKGLVVPAVPPVAAEVVAPLTLMQRIEQAADRAALVAIVEAHSDGAGWTSEHRALARSRWSQVSA